jgi:hypothetical protein
MAEQRPREGVLPVVIGDQQVAPDELGPMRLDLGRNVGALRFERQARGRPLGAITDEKSSVFLSTSSISSNPVTTTIPLPGSW